MNPSEFNECCDKDEIVMSLWYYEEINKFVDDDGFIVWNIYDYITPGMLRLFLEEKIYMCFERSPGYFVEMFYPEGDIDSDEEE